MLFSHLSVTLVSLASGILDTFWDSYCNQVIYMKLFLFFLYLILVSNKRRFDLNWW